MSTLILVPHRDLGAQYLAWMTSITAAAHESHLRGAFPNSLSPKQICLLARGYSDDMTVLHAQSFPRIVIATPSALVAALGNHPTPETVSGLFSTVIVDELDDQLDYVPHGDTSKTLNKVIKAKMKRHPRPTKELLDAFTVANRPLAGSYHTPGLSAIPQLVLASATYREGLVDFVNKHRYFDVRRELVRIKVHPGEIERQRDNLIENAKPAHDRKSGTPILHHALVVMPDGQVRNHPKAFKRYYQETARNSIPPEKSHIGETHVVSGPEVEDPTIEAILAKAEEVNNEMLVEDDTPEELVQSEIAGCSPERHPLMRLSQSTGVQNRLSISVPSKWWQKSSRTRQSFFLC